MNDSNPKDNFQCLTSIIILNYNGGNDLFECIESVKNTIDCNYEIILIDNNSTDGSHLKCMKKFSDIKLIQNNENIGLTRSLNKLIKYHDCPISTISYYVHSFLSEEISKATSDFGIPGFKWPF